MITQSQISTQIRNIERLGLMSVFQSAARKHGISPSLLLAISSRETGMGTDTYVLANNWTGRDGHGKGIMQVDDRYHVIAGIIPGDDHKRNIDYAAGFYADLKRQLSNEKEAIAAYNAGAGGVRRVLSKGLDPDAATTGGNYAADVLARKKRIEKEIGWNFNIASFGEVLPAFLILSGGTGLLLQEIKKHKRK